MTTVFDHLEAYAGEILHGSSDDGFGNKAPFQVVQTGGGPHFGTTTFSTLGLGRYPLPCTMRNGSTKRIRHELIMVLPFDAVPPNAGSILQQVGMEALYNDRAYFPGDVIGPRGTLFEGYEPKALYVTGPVYFPPGFAMVHDEGLGDVVMAWLVPMLDTEVAYRRDHGSDALDEKWEKDDPDLSDYRRTA